MKKVYIETYGCRMNLCDSEIILGILSGHGYGYTGVLADADCVILNGCSVREIGHTKVFERIAELEKTLASHVILIIAGCVSTQLDDSFFAAYPRVQLVIHSTAYKHIFEAIGALARNQSTHLIVTGDNNDEIYDRQLPLRLLEDNVTAAVTIMKGCDFYCSYCIEPYTRGGRTNRSYEGIMAEIADIRDKGYREITLFGHIVDLWEGEHDGGPKNFAQLLSDIAEACPEQRIKFISSHPLTFTDQMADVMARHKNIMRVAHLPVQSGSNEVLRRMNRKYTAAQFVERIYAIKEIVPDINIVTDIMVGFPGEKEKDFEATLKLLDTIRLTDINVFKFSMRKGTPTHKKYSDDVPPYVKEERRRKVYSLVEKIRNEAARNLVGTTRHVVAESRYKESRWWSGRDMCHRTIYFVPKQGMAIGEQCDIVVRGVEDGKLYGELCL